MSNNIIFFDSTLRDGSHAISHQFTKENIEKYCKRIDDCGLYTVIVGHGNGLGASSLHIGRSLLPDLEMLKTAKKYLKKTKLGVLFIPGFGTIRDNLQPALDIGVDVVCVASHCTEADITKQHIEYVKGKGKEVYGILMMQHMADPEKLLEEAKKMESYGALGVILMDSAGASTMEMVSERVELLVKNLDIKVGFHAHNNLGLAISNSYTAIKSGATIIDGTLRGYGAGAGNCQLETLIALLKKNNIDTGLDLHKLEDTSEEVVKNFMTKPIEISSMSITGGLAGVFSGFNSHVKKVSEKFNLDPRDIIYELGRRKMVAGQEDFIYEVALLLYQKKKLKDTNYSIESLS